MRAIVPITLVVSLVAAGTVAVIAWGSAALLGPAWPSEVITALAAALAAAGPTIILMIGARRSAERVNARIGVAIADEAGVQRSTGTDSPSSLEAMFSPGLESVRQCVTSLRGRIRDLEIRLRVAESERRQIQFVLDSLRDIVIVTNPFHEIAVANEAAAKVLGIDRAKCNHEAIEKIAPNHPITRVLRECRQAPLGAEPRHIELEFTVENEPKVFDLTLKSVAGASDGPSGHVAILHDMTREREVSQMKSDFVSKASHELRTPLSSIRAYVEMLVDGEAQDEQSRAEFYRVIQSETDRLGRMIDNMLNISRIEAGILQIDRTQVEMKQLIRRAIETIDPQAKEKDISLTSRCAEVSLTVEGDEDMLYQVILNLLSNGVKYSPEGGRITVTADSDNLTRSVVVSVADTGLGIPPDAIPKLFDKFFRVENFKRVAKGTGLGLNLCKHIVETVHRGQIGVESRLGMGSRFWFSIPMRYVGSQAAA